MTQPEQEAREMLARETARRIQSRVAAGDVDLRDVAQLCGEAWDQDMLAYVLEVAARPTAGIDRARLTEALGSIVSMCADRSDVFPDAATEVEAITEAVNELYGCLIDGVFDLPTPAKTGERNAVIEECARVFSEGLNAQASRLGIAPRSSESPGQWRERVRKAAIRALSQPLPDAPIVGGEG